MHKKDFLATEPIVHLLNDKGIEKVSKLLINVFSILWISPPAGPPKFEVGTRVIGQRADELWYPGKLQDIQCSLEEVHVVCHISKLSSKLAWNWDCSEFLWKYTVLSV